MVRQPSNHFTPDISIIQGYSYSPRALGSVSAVFRNSPTIKVMSTFHRILYTKSCMTGSRPFMWEVLR